MIGIVSPQLTKLSLTRPPVPKFDEASFHLCTGGSGVDHPDIEPGVLMNVAGIQTEVHWFARGKSVGEIEMLFGKLLSDPEYKKVLDKAEGLFVDGTINDHYYRSVSQARGLV